MNIEKMFNKLCSPAKFYLVITTIIFVAVVLQNLINGKMDEFCIGTAKCSTPHIILVFISNIAYTLFWTWLLNWFCSKKLESLSWFIVIIPFLLAAILLGAFLIFALKEYGHPDKKPEHPPIHSHIVE